MGNCPNCGAEMGSRMVVCPVCGGQVEGEASEVSHTEDMETASDTIGDSIGGSGDHTGSGGGAGHPQGGVQGPDATTRPEELSEQAMAEQWVADDAEPTSTIEADASVPGSEIPMSHGGGFQQQDEDGTAPEEITHPPQVDAGVPGSEIPPSHGGGWTQQDEEGEAPPEITHVIEADRPPDEIPEDPRPDLSLDDSGRLHRRRPVPWVGGLAVLLLVVIIALGAWYIWGGDGGDDNGDEEPDGNGDDPYKGLHLHKDGTSGNYPYEPPGEYHITVAVRNNGSNSVDLSVYEVSITVWMDFVNKGDKVEGLSGSLGAGETRTFDVVVETEVLGGGDQLLVGLTLREVEGAKQVHTINFEDTV